MAAYIKQEPIYVFPQENHGGSVISLSSGSQESTSFGFEYSDGSDVERSPKKKRKVESVLPLGFLDPLRPDERLALQQPITLQPLSFADANGVVYSAPIMSSLVKQEILGNESVPVAVAVEEERAGCSVSPIRVQSCKQFWKAGDYEVTDGGGSHTAGMDHVRVHPKFLHSNATSHKWALGAFAELLDNALDEVCHGATYVNVDVLENMKDKSKMLLVEDNGGGMTPDRMRQCMSLGYSAKSKMANTIGQYGNGFKTSTMRLGADVIVFSRSQGKDGESTSQSIGMLSYTFLRGTGKEDIVVPVIHYEKIGDMWQTQVTPYHDYWQKNVESIVQWSPYGSEEDLLQQFNNMKAHGTRIIIYNLWEDDQGSPELDFDADQHDIQIKGVNRDVKKIEMAQKYPNSRHFLTYRHSMRSYASILYRRIPPGFRIILRGKEVDHHDIVHDMMHTKVITYKPNIANVTSKDANMVAMVTLGFVKDATHHIDVQGFNVYHKNRLIKPFWRVWNAAGSDGRGVIGVLEANFIEPAHDKQGFERTVVLSRLETKLAAVQKQYWSTNCQLIGYAPRRSWKKSISPEKVAPATANQESNPNGDINGNGTSTLNTADKTENRQSVVTASGIVEKNQFRAQPSNHIKSSPPCAKPPSKCDLRQPVSIGPVNVKIEEINRTGSPACQSVTDMAIRLYEENNSLRRSLNDVLGDLHYERNKNKSLENQLLVTKQKMNKMDEEQEAFVGSFADDRNRRDMEEVNLRRRLKDACETIENLLKKVELLEARSMLN